MYRVELLSGKVYFVKAVRFETDNRRVYFINAKDHVVRSWLWSNVWSFERVEECGKVR